MGTGAILVIEDEEELRTAIVSCLKTGAYLPVGVASAKEATAKIKNQKFSCVLLDMRLGNETGEQVITFMREEKGNPNFNTPIIVISGFLDKQLVEKIAAKIQGALIKPFGMETLLERVAQIVK